MLGPSGATSRASARRNELQGIMSSPAPCMKVREPVSTVRPFRRHATNLLKADDGAVLPGPRTSPRSIGHTSEQSQNRYALTDRGCRASHRVPTDKTLWVMGELL